MTEALPVNSLTQPLWRALWNADLITVPELHIKCQAAIGERSAAEREFLVAQIGEEAWQRVLTAWNRKQAEQQASIQLGVGAILTEFFVSPVRISDSDRAAAAHLGTLANLIVGVYDDLIDDGVCSGEEPLPHSLLSAAATGSANSSAYDNAPPLATLVSAYFRQMAALPGIADRPEVSRTLRRAIMKMYEAERVTVGDGDADGRMAGWRRKSFLPFVVMGLPAWLMTPNFCAGTYFRHLRWLCRCGEFWGWIDDAMDLEQDTVTGHPNKVQAALHQSNSPDILAAEIAQRGRAVMAQWRRMTPDTAALPLPVQEALPDCLFSAFGRRLL